MYNAQLTYDRIDEMAKLRGISIGKINEMCSLSKNAISNAAKSEFGMKAKNIVLISEILNVSTDYLLGRTDNPNISTESYIGGDNNGVQAIKNNGAVMINQSSKAEQQDEMTTELLKAFCKLCFSDKMKIMNTIMKMVEE